MPTKARTAKTRLYLKTRIAPRWGKEVDSGRPVMFFSPYVTGECARRVLTREGAGRVELYTVFSAENFASGASSFGCLRGLVREGVAAYHLPNLHAKMLLVPGKTLTVGSQNLTDGGTANREATILTHDTDLVRQAADEVKDWVSQRVPITEGMLTDMGAKLPTLRRMFNALKRQSREVDQGVARRQRVRDAEAERTKAELELQRRKEREQRDRLAKLHTSVDRLSVASKRVRTRMQMLVKTERRSGKAKYAGQLVRVEGRASLTSWLIDEKRVDLERLHQYPCIIPKTGKFGWARVGKSRIAFVASSVVHGERVSLFGERWRITTRGEWGDALEDGHNVTVKMKAETGQVIKISCWFSIDGLVATAFKWLAPPPKRLDDYDYVAAVNDNDEGLRDRLMELLLRPFLFSPGHKFGDKRAHKYFGSNRERYLMRLARVGGHPLLIAHRR